VSSRRAALECGLAGAAVSLVLWAIDLASLGSVSFAPVSSAEAQGRLFATTLPAVASLEGRLLALHLAAGLAAGALASAVPGLEVGRRRQLAVAASATLALNALAVAGMMGRYPQLYADRWWAAGGLRAAVQHTVTHRLGPRVFDALFLLVLSLLAVPALTRGATLLRRLPRKALVLSVSTIAALLVAPWGLRSLEHPPSATDPRPSILLLVLDSLRTDRIEAPDVMPATRRLLREGTLFRHAFTPVARTFPSWVSLLTGREPRHTGVRTSFPGQASLRDLGPTFVSELRDRGYRTFVVSDFAGDIFPRIRGGFDEIDTPGRTVDSLARSSVLGAHGWALPFLRVTLLREALPEWRGLTSLSDPEWLVDRAIAHVGRARGRPWLGVVFFSTPHFPYLAPHPDYLWRAGGYAGPDLYQAPPATGERATTPRDVEQVRARYDGAVRSSDRAIGRLLGVLRRDGTLGNPVVVVAGDHGEELYEEDGIAGHGDTIGGERSQVVPVLLVGSGVPRGRVRDDQVRLYDLGATLLGLVEGRAGRTFGDGLDLLVEDVPRPSCVETGLWFLPHLPLGLRGRRLEYPGVAELLEVDPGTRELVLRPDTIARVESAKARGLVLGARMWTEQLLPSGRQAGLRRLPGVTPAAQGVDLAAMFEERCVAGDPSLARFLDAVVGAKP
jgi:arylsulfatase A-like enzyme